MIGQRFGKLLVISRFGTAYPNTPKASATYLCKCDCGSEKVMKGRSLKHDNVTSCGCKSKEKQKGRTLTKGLSKHELYYTWISMIGRCYEPKTSKYNRYGGRGITVCDRWFDFENFIKDMGDRPEGYQLDRINNNGNYEPENCRWVTVEENNQNKENTKFLTYGDDTLSLKDWSKRTGISVACLYRRIKSGWGAEKIINKKPQVRTY